MSCWMELARHHHNIVGCHLSRMNTTNEIRPRPEHVWDLLGRHGMKYRRKLMALSLLVIVFFFWFVASASYAFRRHPKLSPVIVTTLDSEIFNRDCLRGKHIDQSIQEIYTTIQEIRLSSLRACQSFLTVLDSVLSIEELIGEVKLPDKFASQVNSWLGNKDDLFQQIYRQKIYRVVSHLSHEETRFNLLRSKRPVKKSGIDPIQYIDELVNSSSANCDFCNYKDHTAEDVFGRVTSTYSATASNTFKLAKFHSLFFPFSHHPLNLNHSVLFDVFINTATLWFQKAFELDPSQRFPSLLWDTLPHAGASQVHPHIHGLLDAKQYVGAFEQLHQSSMQYYARSSRYLWPDFIELHKCLGLAVEQGSAVAIVPMTAKKDHEFWIISPELNGDVVNLIGRVLDTYRTELNIFCYSAGGALPVLGSSTTLRLRHGLPVILRIGSRGDCTSVGSDVSSLELYTVNNINSDLAQTISALKKTPPRSS